jgi:diguanylate cyclase (GGDEF)-like protein
MVCAIASIIAALTFLTIAPTMKWVVLAGFLQLVVIGSSLSARSIMSRYLAELAQVAESDPATGCLNRRGFARVLDEALTSAVVTRSEVALLSLDVDHFKQVNDRYGHNVGDLVLFEVAATLAETVGKEGIVARLGGEEFSVLMPGADVESAGVMAERMLANIRERCCGELAPGSVITLSIGIAAERVSSLRDGAALRARSDEALYMAKRVRNAPNAPVRTVGCVMPSSVGARKRKRGSTPTSSR